MRNGVRFESQSPVADRFWQYVWKTSSCWIWKAEIDQTGYGKTRIDGERVLAHRVSYQMSGRKLQKGLVIDHLCRNRSCVNPQHLEQVTIAVNAMRGLGAMAVHARKMQCVRGHELIIRPSYMTLGTGMRRYCKTCKNDAERKKYGSKKGGGSEDIHVSP